MWLLSALADWWSVHRSTVVQIPVFDRSGSKDDLWPGAFLGDMRHPGRTCPREKVLTPMQSLDAVADSGVAM